VISLKEAQELHRLVGDPVEAVSSHDGPSVTVELFVLERARELAAVVVADALAEEELDKLLERAEDYPGVVKFVKESEGFVSFVRSELSNDELAYSLEKVLDYLDRGDSTTMENFAEWRKARRKAKKRKKVLLEAAGCWHEELLDRLDNADMTKRERAGNRLFCAELGTALAESRP
jgi:hypothetical protein